MRSLRFDGETDDQFGERAERAACYAKLLVKSCLANRDVQEMIVDPNDPHSEASLQRSPIVRVDFEQAYAIATIGDGLYATRNKHWGDGPQIIPLEPNDPVKGRQIIYVFKENSLYNRRFEQRQRLKELLGRQHRGLVEKAKYKRSTKKMFLEELTEEQASAIRQLIRVEPGAFWRACKGKEFLALPTRAEQTYFDFMANDSD